MPRDLRKEEFDKLVVLDEPPVLEPKKPRGFNRKWKCLCKCGNVKLIKQDNLLAGRSRSCGRCRLIGPANSCWKGHGEISANFWRNIQLHARLRDIEFSVTIEQAWELFLMQDRRCVYTGLLLAMPLGNSRCRKQPDDTRKRTWVQEPTASLDRINSKLTYVLGNIQWVHKTVNLMKLDMSEEEFLLMVKLIGQHCQEVGH